MADFQVLTDFVREMQNVRVSKGVDLLPFREHAAAIALERFGQAFVMEHPAAINIAGLALSMRHRLVSHEIDRGARRLVDETDLHALPDEARRGKHTTRRGRC